MSICFFIFVFFYRSLQLLFKPNQTQKKKKNSKSQKTNYQKYILLLILVLHSKSILCNQSDNRDLAFARSRRRSRSHEEGEIAISPSIAISRRRRDSDRAVDRDRRRGRRTLFSVVVDDFFLGCGLCFSGFVFSFFFSKHQKILGFPRLGSFVNSFVNKPFCEFFFGFCNCFLIHVSMGFPSVEHVIGLLGTIWWSLYWRNCPILPPLHHPPD